MKQNSRFVPVSLAMEIDALCNEFENAWRAKQYPRIEDYLNRVPRDDARLEALRSLLCLEIDLRRQAGEEIDFEEYLKRFPSAPAEVEAVFEYLQQSISSHESIGGVPSREQLSLLGEAGSSDRSPEVADGVPLPSSIGRYQVQKRLGGGAFGEVFLAKDSELHRLVALKLPRPRRFESDEERNRFVEEARTAAQLDYPGIVTVFDVFRDAERVVIVQKYIAGESMESVLASGPFTPERAGTLMAEIADVVAFAHRQGFVHRDLKPANILLDGNGRPHVTDFGLAVHENVQRRRRHELSGTPAYMSPEQVRGEVHRLDGRSDIWSLGVILHEMLTGRRPFEGTNHKELFDEIKYREPRPVRQIKPDVPAELERICLKCLSKRVTERFPSASELAEDLRHWLTGDTPEPPNEAFNQKARIVPKGLRSFGREDADFFLELLPGPRDRHGLPDTIRFWKTQIEEIDRDRSFAVGLLYGPSGCGKTSLVRAGLIPRLAAHVTSMYVECTPRDTETRLLNGLRRAYPEIPTEASLPEVFESLRERLWIPPGKKLVVVLDQFEQWLHARAAIQSTELAAALRQCDGAAVQAVLMVRDDFWMPVSEFMRQVEVRIIEGHNAACVSLFDVLHSRRVLFEFGRAYGRLPESLSDLTPSENAFLNQTVAGLAQEGKVICVRLSLFADMMKGREWTTSSLKEVGGTAGVGVTFLEETFSARSAPPDHRRYQEAARAVLSALLPTSGADIKGGMKSYEQLLEASGYMGRTKDFDSLMRILDAEIRLITPTEADDPRTIAGNDVIPSACVSDLHPPVSGLYYQLTHDYLIPVLREWLSRKQKETRKGRAELRLAERSALWNAKPESQQLPAWWEDLSIRLLTRRKNWTEPQKRMMRRAAQYFGVRTAIAVALIGIIGVAGFMARNAAIQRQMETRANGLVDALLAADISKLPDLVRQLTGYRGWADPRLYEALRRSPDNSNEHFHASLALLPVDRSQVSYLKQRLVHATPQQFLVVRDALAPHRHSLVADLWSIIERPPVEQTSPTLQAASALARYDPHGKQWQPNAGRIADALVSVNPVYLNQWLETLRPARSHLIAPLTSICANSDGKRTDTQRTMATNILGDYAADQPAVLAELVVAADAGQFAALFPVLERHGAQATLRLEQELDRELAPVWKDPQLDPAWETPDASLVQQIEAGYGVVHERFAICQTMPFEECVKAVESLRACGYRPLRLRPFVVGNRVQAAAIWTRDGREWRFDIGLSAENLMARERTLRDEGFLPVDVAGYPDASARNGAAAPPASSSLDPSDPGLVFTVLWVQRTKPEEDARLFVAASDEELPAVLDDLKKDGVDFQRALQACRTADGRIGYNGVASAGRLDAHVDQSMTTATYDVQEHLDKTLWDVCVYPAAAIPTGQQRFARQLAQAEERLKAAPDDLDARWLRAVANVQLGHDALAAEDLDALVAKSPQFAASYQWRALARARTNQADKAKEDLAKFKELNSVPSVHAYLDAQVSAYLGDEAGGVQRLEEAVAANPKDNESLYNAACAFALLAAIRSEDAEKARSYADRSMTLLKQAVHQGYSNFSQIQTDPDLEALHSRAEFQGLLQAGQVDTRYAAIWQVSREYQAEELHGLYPQEHRDRMLQLVNNGYRPAAISVASIHEGAPLVTASAWHHPVVSEDIKEALAQRQANAAVALLRMGQDERAWPLLKHQPDPRARSWLIHRAGPLGVQGKRIADRLGQEREVSIRRALILSLGEYDGFPAAERDRLSRMLRDLYREDPDPGIHGASEWLLRRWGRTRMIEEVDRDLATGHVQGQRRWYLTGYGHTMVVMPPPVDFVMGSPGTEQNRQEDEDRHHRRINRGFAIATKEVTVDQFQRFLRENPTIRHSYRKQYSPERTTPQTSVIWYEAAAYCRWLSEQAGVSEDQMCYPVIAEIKEGLQLPKDYLRRTGYRLPTEAEWEYACRAGSTTSWYHGETAALLSQYAWYDASSTHRSWPVASLKPNDFGLFDMQGNVWEWCQESSWGYPIGMRGAPADDAEDMRPVTEKLRRVLRGGSFFDHADVVRAAYRYSNVPDYRPYSYGFRVARTFP